MVLLDGIHVPLATPFYRDGSLYLRKLEHNVRRYSLTPASALLAFDPRLESSTLSDAERRDCLHAIRETAAPEKVLVAAVVENSVAQALAVAAEAHDAQFDAIALAAPPSWPSLLRRSGDREILLYFRAVADASPLPVVLWSDAATPALCLSVESTAALATHPNIVGLYDADLTMDRLRALQAATKDIRQEATVTTTFRPVTRRMLLPSLTAEAASAASFVSAEMLTGGAGVSTVMPMAAPEIKTRTKALGFQILAAGPAPAALPLLQAGAAGAAPVLAAPAPQAVHEVYAAFSDKNPELAAEKSDRLAVADALLAELGPAAVKYAADLTGYFGGLPRLPIVPLDSPARVRVEEAFRELRN